MLAKLPDAPEGVKGISLFLVPKFLPTAENTPGQRNGVRCNAIEEKMGIHGNATCQLFFDGAIGWMVGQPNKGLAAMFTMMNAARLGVGMQGLGTGESPSRLDYACHLDQGRSLAGRRARTGRRTPSLAPRRAPDAAADESQQRRRRAPLRDRAGDRQGRQAQDPQVRQDADDFVQLMTPIIKST